MVHWPYDLIPPMCLLSIELLKGSTHLSSILPAGPESFPFDANFWLSHETPVSFSARSDSLKTEAERVSLCSEFCRLNMRIAIWQRDMDDWGKRELCKELDARGNTYRYLVVPRCPRLTLIIYLCSSSISRE